MSVAALDKLAVEIFEEILVDIERDKTTLIALSLTCHALLERTRSHLFPVIILHDHNFDAFLELTLNVPWNSVLPYVQHLVLGSKMFPLSSLSFRQPEQQSRDLATWAAQFRSLRSLHLRGGVWSEFPRYLKDALLSLCVEHLDVCIDRASLSVEEFTMTVFPAVQFKALSISGPLWQKNVTEVPFYPAQVPESTPFYIHHIQLYEARPLQGLINWLRDLDASPPVMHLFIALPKQSDNVFADLVTEVLRLTSPIHLYLKLPTETRDIYKFPIKELTNIRTLRISSIYNDGHLSPLVSGSAKGQGDIPTTCSILQQFIPLQHQLREIQLDSVCSHLNLMWGDIPEILNTSFSRLKGLNLTVRSGRAISKKHLEAWLDKSPFEQLRARGVKVGVDIMMTI